MISEHGKKIGLDRIFKALPKPITPKKEKKASTLRKRIKQLEKQNRRLRKKHPTPEERKPHPFYDSREWRELRYSAIKKYGRKCMACLSTEKTIHVDHIKPRSKFPDLALELSNLQILCADCNLGKSNKDATDWRSA